MSRNPSPNIFIDTTRRNKAIPGKTINQGWKKIASFPSAIRRPHDGVGGCIPTPKKKD